MPTNPITEPHTTAPTLTTREAAARLGLAVRSVQLMVDRGELRAWKTSGGHRRIDAGSVDQWLNHQPVRDRSPSPLAPHAPRGDAAGSTALGPAALPPSAGAAERMGRNAVGNGTPRRPTVVLIEDSMHFQNVERLIIQKHHPQVDLHVASDAIVGMALCGALRPDVLIVDLLLPGVDGAALIGSVRSQPQFRGVQLMVVTGLDAEQRRPYAYAIDGLPVVEKRNLAQQFSSVLGSLVAHSPPRG